MGGGGGGGWGRVSEPPHLPTPTLPALLVYYSGEKWGEIWQPASYSFLTFMITQYVFPGRKDFSIKKPSG